MTIKKTGSGTIKNRSKEEKNCSGKNRKSIRNLNLHWMNEMVNSEPQLREKMSLFRHRHFACRSQNKILNNCSLLQPVRRGEPHTCTFCPIIRKATTCGICFAY